jgi:ATP-dependent DNA helicase RecG
MNFGSETEILEFKKTTSEKKEAVVSISSILNKHGKGEVYFGIKNDGTVLGQEIGALTLRDVSKEISEQLKPQIYPAVNKVIIDNKKCIRVTFEGSEPPYFAYGRVYMRVADEDRQLSPSEVEEYFRRKISQNSDWDASASNITIQEIDENKLREYIEKANTVGRINYKYSNVVDILKRLKLMVNDVPTNAAEAMFGKDAPAEIQMASFATDEKITFNDIKRQRGTINEVIDAGERYIRSIMRWRVVLDGSMQREEIPEIPIDAIRESLQNSYCHKDWYVHQINEIAIFSNRIEIYNPGTFPIGVMPEDFINGVENSIHRNPLLAELMYYTRDIESFGTGLKRIADACRDADVKYEFQLRQYGFCVIFYRNPAYGFIGSPDDPINDPISDPIKKELNDTAVKILNEIANDGNVTYEELAALTGVSTSAIKRNIRKLKETGKIRRAGGNKSGYWEITSI